MENFEEEKMNPDEMENFQKREENIWDRVNYGILCINDEYLLDCVKYEPMVVGSLHNTMRV